MSVTSISFIKRLSLILSRKAYLIYTKNPIPSLLVPLPQIDNTIKSAIIKKFTDLTNDDVLIFNHKNGGKGSLSTNQQLQNQTKLQIGDTNLPQFDEISSIENIVVKPDSLFLTLNQEDSSLAFMKYQQIQNSILNAKQQKGSVGKQAEKPKQPKNKKVEQSKENKQTKKGQQQISKQVEEDKQFKDEPKFERQQMSTWNEQSPQLSTKPQDQPKEDISSLRTHKFVPLAILTDQNFNKPLEIFHIQTSRQYLLLQMLKVFFLANVLCVYGLVKEASRTENHDAARKRIE